MTLWLHNAISDSANFIPVLSELSSIDRQTFHQVME
ncbi:Uncharacterised protein [Yersinia intermedia]|nr:Uncharacterised protein [Yersinia intermedia]